MYTYVISSLLTCVILLILTIFVLYKSPNRPIRRIYALHSTSIALWSFCFFKMISSTSRTEGLFWARILHTGAIFIPIFFYHFTLVTFNKAKYKRGFLTVSYIFGIILLIGFYLSPMFVLKEELRRSDLLASIGMLASGLLHEIKYEKIQF